MPLMLIISISGASRTGIPSAMRTATVPASAATHAAAQEATVTLTADGSGQLKVVIADDGQGFIPSTQRNGKARPLGLTSMRERVEALGGTFQVTSQPG